MKIKEFQKLLPIIKRTTPTGLLCSPAQDLEALWWQVVQDSTA